MTWVTVNQVEDALDAVDFPADKDALLAQAEAQDAPEEVLKALRSPPPEITYANIGEVIRSVGVNVGSPPTAEQHALRARDDHGRSGVTERLRPPP